MKKILVVDDDQAILQVVASLLTLKGFNVKTHSSGLDVSEIVVDYHPDLVLLDIGLPGKLGTQVCNELKEEFINLPVILFSAHAKEKAYKVCSADAFIEKPFDISNLINTIRINLN